MGQEPKKAYLYKIRSRYNKADKAAKGAILDEFCAVCGFHRKHAIRLLNQKTKRRKTIKKTPGRKPIYDDIIEPLKKIWMATDYMCSKRLKAALPLWLPHYTSIHGSLAPLAYDKLLRISPSTIDRLLQPIRASQKRKGLSGTKPGSLLKNQIPIKTDHWDVMQPGFLEADTVAHCGNSLAGDFVWSLTMTDILTCWTECRATWNKGASGVCEQIHHIENSLPFPILGFDCDNGSEFLNPHIYRYFVTDRHDNKVQFTRSRPYKKNDNAHVEQKNWTHVRQCFGYDRLDQPQLVALMNDLYMSEWSLYQNHFCPGTKLIEKTKINSKYKRKYDRPKTPYQRILDCDAISDEQKESLKKVHNGLNPFVLKENINQKLKEIFKHVKVTSNVRQRI